MDYVYPSKITLALGTRSMFFCPSYFTIIYICIRWNVGISGRKIKEWEIGYKDVSCFAKIETDFIMWKHRAIGLLALLAILVSVHAEGKTIFLCFLHFPSNNTLYISKIIENLFRESLCKEERKENNTKSIFVKFKAIYTCLTNINFISQNSIYLIIF